MGIGVLHSQWNAAQSMIGWEWLTAEMSWAAPLSAVVIFSFSLGGYSTGQYSTAPRGTNRRLRTDRYDISADVDAAGPVPKPRTRSGRESSSQISRRWCGFRGSDHVQITSTSTMNCTIRLSDRISLLSIYSLIIVYYISLYSR